MDISKYAHLLGWYDLCISGLIMLDAACSLF